MNDQSQLWTGEFDYAPRDTLTLQEEVAAATSREIQLRLSPEALVRSRRINPLAFDAYLRGRYFFRLAGRENTDNALHYYSKAISHDSAYALAWVWLSEARRRAGDRGFAPAEESRRQSREAIERALSLDPKLADAHSQLGWLKMLVDWDWSGSDASFKHALALDPGNADVASGASVIAAKLGRYDEAVELARRSVELDPLNPEMVGTLGQLFYDIGRLDEAEASLKRSLQLFSLPHAPALLGLVYLAQGRLDSALAAMNRETSPVWQLHGRALTYHSLGRKSDADSALAQFITRYGAAGPYFVAQIYNSEAKQIARSNGCTERMRNATRQCRAQGATDY